MSVNISCGRRTYSEGCYDPIPGSAVTVADTSTKGTYSYAAPGTGCKVRIAAYGAALKVAVGRDADAAQADQAIYMPANSVDFFEYQPGDSVSYVNA